MACRGGCGRAGPVMTCATEGPCRLAAVYRSSGCIGECLFRAGVGGPRHGAQHEEAAGVL